MSREVLPGFWCRLLHYLTWLAGPWAPAGPYEMRTVRCPTCATSWPQRRRRPAESDDLADLYADSRRREREGERWEEYAGDGR